MYFNNEYQREAEAGPRFYMRTKMCLTLASTALVKDVIPKEEGISLFWERCKSSP